MIGIRQICHGDGCWRVICILDYWGVVMVVIPNTGTTKIRNGHFWAKWGEMGMFLAKWGQNGQFLGEMDMFNIDIAYNPHANTSLTVRFQYFE